MLSYLTLNLLCFDFYITLICYFFFLFISLVDNFEFDKIWLSLVKFREFELYHKLYLLSNFTLYSHKFILGLHAILFLNLIIFCILIVTYCSPLILYARFLIFLINHIRFFLSKISNQLFNILWHSYTNIEHLLLC